MRYLFGIQSSTHSIHFIRLSFLIPFQRCAIKGKSSACGSMVDIECATLSVEKKIEWKHVEAQESFE